MQQTEKNTGLVVVSDIHLGEDLIARASATLQHSINRLNEEFVAFVQWLQALAAKEQRPYELVINGDMFDFVKISLRPDAKEAYMRWQQGLAPHEKKNGLDNTPERVVWKLERILDSHRPLFLQMAEFIGEGNCVHIVAGNHDREFYYQEVMLGLRRALADLYFSIHPETPGARDAFDTRIDFSMWFHLTKSGVYIEHGHQYDPYCSFEYLLAPRKRPEEMKVALPLTHKAIPYFVDLMGGMSTHNMDQKGVLTFVRETAALGPKAFVAIAWAYLRAVTTILGEAGGKSQRVRLALLSEHVAERREVAEKYTLTEAQAQALDALHATPAEFSMMKMVQCFYVDRFALYLVGLLALLGETMWLSDPKPRIVAMLGTVFCVLVASTYLARLRRFDTRLALREGARGVMSVLGARTVIFGHSHRPEVVTSNGHSYVNIGSWISRAALLGEAEWGMTFALVGGDDANGLYRWVGNRKTVALVTELGRAPSNARPEPALLPEDRSALAVPR